ncbi:hypothetical protein BJ322DRAFT_1047065 [Thelephora terrestris]|uniref:Uncharacterized protein n=1 Tax=Thelephora terrestris TaxID=56493 RepID=A0A9P6HJ43_9AGAM|nr:hypothetical protein BJ322DRAFT_1047065 [Thelephora terrestris]
MASRQSQSGDARLLSPLVSTSPSAAGRDFSLSASGKATQPSLEHLNEYVRKHFERFVEHESLERSRLAASFAEKEQSYEKQISTLRADNTDISALLAQERSTNSELRQKLDVATNSMARLCKVVADVNSISVNRGQVPHEVKQEDNSQGIISASDMKICPSAVIASQADFIVTELNASNGVGLPSSSDLFSRHSIVETFGKVADSLLATQRSFALLLDNFKSADAARVDSECQNTSLQEKITLLREELRQKRSDNEKIAWELAAARLERERHVCQPPLLEHPAPALQTELPLSLPSPPLERRDLPIPNDKLQDTHKISRKTNQAPEKRSIPENVITPPPTPNTKAGPSSASLSTSGKRRKVSVDEALDRVKTKSASSIATQSGPPEVPIVRDDQQIAGPSVPPPSTPVQGVKRTSSDSHKCQNSHPPIPSTSTSTTSPISDRTSNRPLKKRRLNGASSTPLKNKSTNENPATNADTTHKSTSTTGPPSASSSKHNMVQLPKTSASDLKSLKFNKTSHPTKPPPAPALATTSNTNTPTKSNRPPMRPLDLAKKSPQERAALRKAK